MCSFDSQKCGNNQRMIISRDFQTTISTGVDLTRIDVCPYQIVTDNTLTFNTKVKVKIDTIINADVYLLVGQNISYIEDQYQLYEGDTQYFKASKQAFLIVKANYENPYVQFSIKSTQIIPDWAWMLIIIGSSVLYFGILLVGVIYLTKYLTQKKLREMQSPNIVYFLKKKVFQYQQVNQDEKKPDKPKSKDLDFLGLPPIPPKKNSTQNIFINNLDDNRAPTPIDDLNKQRILDEKKKNIEELVIPDHSHRPESHENLMGQTEGLGRLTTAPGDSRFDLQSQGNNYNNQNGPRPIEKPKVSIRPYKINFD